MNHLTAKLPLPDPKVYESGHTKKRFLSVFLQLLEDVEGSAPGINVWRGKFTSFVQLFSMQFLSISGWCHF